MKYGVVYKLKDHKKINGTLFYCFEYFSFLRNFVDVSFYITNIKRREEFQRIITLFKEKYINTHETNIVPIKTIDLYTLNLDHTIVLDIHTFNDCREFLTNSIHCFSNETHNNFQYKNNRRVIYYGSYPSYQKFDIFSYLKLNFSNLKPLNRVGGEGVFVSGVNAEFAEKHKNKWVDLYAPKRVIIKQANIGRGNIFDYIDTVHYVHTSRDKNNRIIPETFYYGKRLIIENNPYLGLDSIRWRYDDITQNGLSNYTLTEKDEIITACLKS